MVVLNKLEKKKKLKDTEYLFISAYLRAREGKLLTAARMERMIDAPSPGEAAKVLQEIGYGEFSPTSDRELGAALAREREKLFENLYRYVPDKAVVDVFKVKYDYHNLKVLLKARALGMDGKRLLVDAGRVETERMEKCVSEGTYDQLPTALGQAAEEAGRSSAPPATPSAATSLWTGPISGRCWRPPSPRAVSSSPDTSGRPSTARICAPPCGPCG